ncbi:putative 26S proteasome complex subunit SEM1 [Kluyveromyces marxianus]
MSGKLYENAHSNYKINTTNMSTKEPVRSSLEDDDEFEDFPADSWPSPPVSQDLTRDSNLWAEDWDDIEVEDDFTKELKEELEKQ